MKSALGKIAGGLMLALIGGVGGCAVHVGPPPGPAVTVGYDPYYYDRGWYADGFWYWYGPDHHLYHEDRVMHERRWHDRHYDHHDWH
jgi:hypothetical protein